MVLGSKTIGEFRIMNSESEQVLKVALEKLEDVTNYNVSISKTDFKRNISDNILLICEELKQYGSITAYMPYGSYVIITLSEFGKTYFNEKENVLESMNEPICSDRDIIFISHRSVDAPIADMIKDFLVNCGTPNNKVFCSSLPGNDVDERIEPEVKEALKRSIINILVLSKSYYESAYCLNEAGIAWYLDEVVAIPFGLPEIDHKNMVGFLNEDYKLRRLDNDTDVSYLIDKVQEKLNVSSVKHAIITQETRKLIEKYNDFISNRIIDENVLEDESTTKVTIETDECLLLVYAAGPDGKLIVEGSITRSGVSVLANGFDFAEADTPYECARWKGAVNKLEECGLIENPKLDGKVYLVTKKGFDTAKKIKEQVDIDISKNPKSYLEEKEI